MTQNNQKYNIVTNNNPMNRNSIFTINGWEIIKHTDPSVVYVRTPSGSNYFLPVDLILFLAQALQNDPAMARNFIAGTGIKSSMR